jgi:ATP-binding cassette subfamily C protein
MRLLITFARIYPLHSIVMVIALLLAGVLEGVGLSMLLPILGIAVGQQSAAGQLPTERTVAMDSALERWVTEAFSVLGMSPTVGVLLIIFITAITVKSALMLLAKKQVGYTVARVATDLRLEMLRALLVSRWQYFLKQPLGSLANSMATESARASKAYMHGVLMSAEFIQAVIYGLVAFLVSWEVTLIAFVPGLFVFYVLRRFVKKARRAGIRQTDVLKSLLALLADTLQSIKPLKAMARENVSDLLLEKKTNHLNKALQKQVLNKEFLKAFQEQLLTIILAVGLYVMLIYWHMPLASIVVLILLISKFLKQLSKVQMRYQEMVIFESAYWSLKETIEAMQLEREVLTGSGVPELKRAISMRNVNFAYDDHQVLYDISLTFPAGYITSIVGPSGSGKTTIVDLVTGLLRPQQGEVWIDDQPLTQIDQKRWRRMIGYVPQETLLLHDTILTNVTLGDNGLSEDDAIYALRAAEAWDFVKALPQGMESIVGERGGKLSGGQRQRIAIARALVHRPKLLILDEATTGLDPESEAAICDTLRQLSGKLTILTISHQSALVKIANKVYRLHDGEIVTDEDRSDRSLPSGEVNTNLDFRPQEVSNPRKMLKNRA